MKNGLLTLALISITALCSLCYAKPLTDLLEQATHQEESVGNLDAAIDLYGQVIETHEADKQLVAQALYRRALCYQKLGRSAEAQASLQQILTQYSEQKSITKLAKQTLNDLFGNANALLPVPWKNNELIKYELKSPGGAQLGFIHTETQLVETKNKNHWRLDTYLSVPINQMFQFSRVNASEESFAMKDSYVTNSQLGNFLTSYTDDQIITINNFANGQSSEKSLDMDTKVYDYEQLAHVGRRLPLSSQYATKISVYYAPTNIITKANIKVVNEEKITVPLGTFDAYKVNVSFESTKNPLPSMTVWISKAEDKQILKYDSQGAIAVLSEVSLIDDSMKTVEDPSAKMAFSLPPNWRAMNSSGLGNQFSAFYNIFAPKMDAMAMLIAREINTRDSNISLPILVENDINVLKSYFKNYTVRDSSRTDFLINNAPAFSYAADYQFQNFSMVEYRTYIQGAQGVYWFIMRADATKFEQLKNEFDQVASSLVVPLPEEPSAACNNKKHSNLLSNSDFSQGETNWIPYLHNNQPDADLTFDDGLEHALIRVRDGGKVDWHVQLVQEGVCLEYTKKYRLSFDYSLLANVDQREFTTSVQRTGNGYTNYIFPQPVVATSDIQRFTYDFMMTAETDTNARVLFNFGGKKFEPSTPESLFAIDNVSIIEL